MVWAWVWRCRGKRCWITAVIYGWMRMGRGRDSICGCLTGTGLGARGSGLSTSDQSLAFFGDLPFFVGADYQDSHFGIRCGDILIQFWLSVLRGIEL